MSFLYSRKDVIKLMSNFDFTKTLLNGSKQYIDEKTSDGSTHSHSWNDLEDRPFGEVTAYSDTVTLDWKNAEPIGLFGEKNVYFVSEVIPSLNELKNAYCKAIYDPQDEATVFPDEVDYPDGGDLTSANIIEIDNAIYTSTYGLLVSYVDNMDINGDGSLLLKKGTYFYDCDFMGTPMICFQLMIKGFGKFPTTELKIIDQKYLPEHTHSFNDLTDKPFYDSRTETEIISETTIAEFEEYDTNLYGYKIRVTDMETFGIGETYTVVWDGVTYENIQTVDYYGIGLIGSTYNDFVNGDNTYPFGIDVEFTGDLDIVVMTNDNRSHTFKVTKVVGDLKTIDSKYLPKELEATALILSSPNGTRFEITVGDDGVLTALEMTIE